MTAALVNKASSVSAAAARKGYRWWLQDAIARCLPGERVAHCHRKALCSHVDVRNGEHGASFGGLETCSSVWACPICAPKIQRERAEEVGALIKAHTATGGSVFMGALTLRHNAGQPCKPLRDAVTKVWSQVLSCRPFDRAASQARYVGAVRAAEVTYGQNGWHPHIHVLLFFGADALSEDIEALGFTIFEQWAKRMDKRGFGPCNPSVFQFEEADTTERAGDYVTKWGAEWEIVSGHTKAGKAGGLSPWEIAAKAGHGSKRHRLLFREYYAAFKGCRQLTYTKGLRERYGLRDPKTDEEVTADDAEVSRPLIGQLPRKVFWQIRARGLLAEFERYVHEHPCWMQILAWLKGRGINANKPPPQEPAAGRARPEHPGSTRSYAAGASRCSGGRLDGGAQPDGRSGPPPL